MKLIKFLIFSLILFTLLKTNNSEVDFLPNKEVQKTEENKSSTLKDPENVNVKKTPINKKNENLIDVKTINPGPKEKENIKEGINNSEENSFNETPKMTEDKSKFNYAEPEMEKKMAKSIFFNLKINFFLFNL